MFIISLPPLRWRISATYRQGLEWSTTRCEGKQESISNFKPQSFQLKQSLSKEKELTSRFTEIFRPLYLLILTDHKHFLNTSLQKMNSGCCIWIYQVSKCKSLTQLNKAEYTAVSSFSVQLLNFGWLLSESVQKGKSLPSQLKVPIRFWFNDLDKIKTSPTSHPKLNYFKLNLKLQKRLREDWQNRVH